ncbi:hypothetical protein PY092_10025 [Muricauda sp. 334s03]|uniref:Uncharacterized protein n=1 Tax=Flagellimonas yonaguniensis TaxID=3031325 RepID=A0ABT5XZ69_9FLAO|nr:hypothetical protein [[Muricauda] yonaguniensis]MDF0716486.1 hypothetical protein [[Muricauda] yonaguniensis]
MMYRINGTSMMLAPAGDYIIKPDGMRDYQLYHPDVQQIPE